MLENKFLWKPTKPVCVIGQDGVAPIRKFVALLFENG